MRTQAITKTRKEFGAVVPPRSAANIEQLALAFRKATETDDDAYLPIVGLYDLLHILVPGASYDVRTKDEMGDNHGLTLLRRKEIWIREDVFHAACRGEGMGRFTLCHELGHLLMHDGVTLQRAVKQAPIYMSSEWQSDMFAGAVLMPDSMIAMPATVADLMSRFGVSRSAAEVRLSQLRKRNGS
jgi:Zn-dependent peptidase ImmA (M78 family)